MIKWDKYFDAIYCLSLADNVERRADCEVEFKRVGILDSGIFHWKITVKNWFYNLIWSNRKLKTVEWFLKNNKGAPNITLGHYEIMKECLAIGYKHVLILEDDIRFHKNIDFIKEHLELLPDYDICLFDKFVHEKELFWNAVNNKINDKFFDFSSAILLSCGCYALSQKGMEFITKKQEEFFMPPDHYTNKTSEDDIKRISSIQNIAVQDFVYKTYENEEQKNIDIRAYKGIADKNDFNVKLIIP